MGRSLSWDRNRIFAALFMAATALGGNPLRAQQLIVTIPTGATDPLNNPQSIVFDRLGNLFIADKGNARVQRVDKESGIVTTIAGTGVAGYNGDDIPATTAQLNCPASLVFDAAGALYVADTCDNRVRKIAPAMTGGLISHDIPGTISTYAGNGGVGQVLENVPAQGTPVAAPMALAIDSAGNLFISSKDDVARTQAIRRVDGHTQLITNTSYLGDVATFSQLVTSSNELLTGWSNGIAFATNGGAPLTGNDNFNPIGLFAGLFAPDGSFRPSALAQDSGGNLYVANIFAAPSEAAWIFRVTPGVGGLTAGTAAPFAGNSAKTGYDGDGGPPLLAKMNSPQGLAVNSADNLYIADSANNAVRAVIKATATPAGTPQITPLDQHGAASAVDLTFSGGVTTAGDTAVVVGQLLQAVPQGFVLLGQTPLAFDVVTSAQYSGSILICINQPSIPPGARLLHFDPATQLPQDVTISVTSTRICGQVTSLSPFAIVVPVEHNEPPAITSGTSATFQVGIAGAFSVTATGTPTPGLTESGALPAGVAFAAATGVLAGTPIAAGVYTLTFTAHNGAGADAVQAFSLTVTQAPSITTANSAAFTQGTAGSFTVSAAGFPLPRLQATSLPPGLAFLDNGDGSGSLNGTPTTPGSFAVVITAANGVGASATQTLNVNIAPTATTGGSLSVTPAQIDFGAFRFLHLSTREVIVKNTGSTGVSLTGMDLTPGAGVPRDSFFDLNLCGSRLAPGKSCSVLVFYLTVRPGIHAATLRINSDAAGSPQVVTLKGTTLNW